MKMKTALFLLWGFALFAFALPPALAFGPVAHSVAAHHTAQYLGAPQPLLLPEFLSGANGPDVLSLEPHGLSHNLEIAEIMLEFAQTEEQAALAYGYACHILTDLAGHGTCLPCCDPEDEIPQIIAEGAIDYLLYNSEDPGEAQTGQSTTVACDAQLLADAVAEYNDRHGHPYNDVPASEIQLLCDLYAGVIEVEKAIYADPNLRDDAEANQPMCWRYECFQDSVSDCVSWVLSHPSPVKTGSQTGPAGIHTSTDYTYPFESPDTDEDGILDCGVRDNCPSVHNPDQTDADADDYGAACDCDDENPDVNPGAEEIPGNGLDDDCNPDTPDSTAWTAATTAQVSTAERFTAGGSGLLLNALSILCVPLCVLFVWKRLREKNP